VRITHLALNATFEIFELRLTLAQRRFGNLSLTFDPAALPDRNAHRAGNRERSMRLRRIHPDNSVISANGERWQPLGSSRRARAFSGFYLRLCCLLIPAVLTHFALCLVR